MPRQGPRCTTGGTAEEGQTSTAACCIHSSASDRLVALPEVLAHRDAAPIVDGTMFCPHGLATDRVDRRPPARAREHRVVAAALPRLNKMPTCLAPNTEHPAVQADDPELPCGLAEHCHDE